MKIYISGPISGMPDLNKPAFMAAEEALRAAGFDVVNPVNNGLPDSAEWHEHMRADIKMLMDCDGVAMLEGWMRSRGAKLEREIAMQLGMTVKWLPEWSKAAA